MKLFITFLALSAVMTSCHRIVDKGAKLILTTKNETNHSVSVNFFPVKGGLRLVNDLVLAPLTQQDKTILLEASVVPIGDDSPYVSYGNLDSIRVVFDNSRFLSFRRPVDRKECNIAFNIFCESNHVCTKQSDSKGQCVYTITEEMFNRAKPL